MNTKYPINGRVATLNDLVHEYGASSIWPKNTVYPFIDTSKNIVSQPFQNLVFKDTLDANNKFIGERPYEIVYFDNVYSTTERDNTGKQMKIIQQSDSVVFSDLYPGGISGHEYIKAGDVANPGNIIRGKYGFKFIVASQNDKKQYYYNYRTSTGEATVMYALRNIIRILKEYISNNNTDGTLEKSLIQKLKQLFIPKKDKNSNNEEYPEINNIIDKDNNELKSNAYKYLGDFIWTYKNINIKNYTRTEQSILNIAENKGYLTLNNNSVNSINTLLKNWLGDNKDDNYSYNQKSFYNQLKYYLNIFANSQRFFVSYVTGFRFGKISNKSYLQIEPVLRCDLGVLRIYKSLIIISAVHDWQTALPAGKILYDTSINIILQYKVKYKNLQTYSSPITTTIGPISFNDIKKYREPTSKKKIEDNKEEIENDIWYTLKTYVGEKGNGAPAIPYGEKYSEDVKYYNKTYKYGTTYFPALPSDEFNNIDTSISNSWYSLQDLQWPSKEILQLPSIDDVSNSRGNPKFISPVSNLKNYEDTNNNNIFVGDAEDVIGNKGIAPFGILRIHSSLDLSDENIKVSSYYIDTSIYRCKNYYYITKDNQSSENATVTCYFTPKYKSYSPYIEIPIFRSNEIIQPISLQDEFSNILNAGNYYSIPSNLNTLYFTVQSGTAKTITYASGVTKKLDNNDAKYITNNTFEFYYQDQDSADKDSWIKYTGSDITVTMAQGNNIVNHYEISFYFSKIESNYWRIKLSDINQNFYFRINKIKEEETKTKLSIYNLSVTDNMDGTTEYKLGIYPGKPNDLSLKYAIFIDPSDDKFLTKQNALSIFDSTFNNQSYDVYTIDTDNNKSLYIQLISIKTSEQYISNYTKNFNNIKLYVAYPDSNNKYKFSNTTIFYGEYQDSRVKIENYINKPNIYLSFEPIYIIKTGKITASNDDNVIDDYKHFFDPENFKLKQITLNHSGNINTVKSDGTFINSIYSEIVYIDSDSIYIGTKKLSDIIFSDNNDINNYLFEFLIIFNNITKNETNQITISNNTDNFNRDNFNKLLKDKAFAGNNEYYVSIQLKMFRLKPSYYTVSVDNTIDTSVSFNITINDLPPEYHGNDITKDNTYDLPKSVPSGTKITVNHKFNQEINPELVQIILKNTKNNEIANYSYNDTITIYVNYNITISVTISTPDTSNNNP